MGVSHSPAQAAGKLRAFASQLESGKLTSQGVDAAALTYTNAARVAYRARTGDGKLSGVGLRGARVGARYDRKGDVAIVRATGPAHLIESPTKPHAIEPRKRRGKKAVLTPAGPRARVAKHPGTHGRPTFFPAVLARTKLATRAFASPVVDGLRKTFR